MTGRHAGEGPRSTRRPLRSIGSRYLPITCRWALAPVGVWTMKSLAELDAVALGELLLDQRGGAGQAFQALVGAVLEPLERPRHP